MANPVVVEFILRGMPEISRAMRTVEQATAASDRNRGSATQRASQQRVSIEEREAKAKVRAMLRADADVKRIQDRAVKDTERRAQQRARAEERAEREMVRTAEKAANDKIRISRQVDREIAASAKKREAENNRILREGMRLEDQAHRARLRQQQRAENERQNDRKQFARGLGQQVVTGATAGAGKVAGFAGQAMGVTAQLGGGFSIADTVMNESKLRKQAATLSASTIISGAGKPGADASLGKSLSTDDVLDKAKAIGIENNIDPAEVMKGFDEVKKLTGNLSKATELMPELAKLSTATGSDLGEVAGLGANVLAANPNISNEEFQKQMRLFTRQGVVGGVEVGDFAKYGSRITSGAAMYGGNRETNEATLGAMAQMSRQYGGASTAAEATLGAKQFGSDIAKHAADLKAGGIDVSDGKGNLKDAQTVLLEMLEKTGGDVTKLAGLGLGERGVKPLAGVASLYKEAGGGEAGKKRVQEEFKKYTSGTSKAEIDEAAKRVRAEQQVEAELMKVKLAFGKELLPEFQKMAPVIRDLIPQLGQVVKIGLPAFIELMRTVADFVEKYKGTIADFAAHPFATIVGLSIAQAVGSSVVSTMVGKALEGVLNRLGGGGGGGPAPTSAADKGSNAGVVGGVFAQGYATYQVVSQTLGAKKQGQAEAAQIAADLQSNDPAVRERAKKQSDAASESVRKMSTFSMYNERIGKGLSVLNPATAAGMLLTEAGGEALTGKTSAAPALERLKASEIVDSDAVKLSLTKSVSDAVAAGAKQGMQRAVDGMGTAPGGRPPEATKDIINRNNGTQ